MVTKLTIEYDGSGFAGWARQPGRRTVQEELERALQKVLGERGQDDCPLRLTVAGRTDAGVHALANVVSAEVDGGPSLEKAVDALNAVLPDDLSVQRAEEVAPEFNARFSARSRTYRYRVWTRRERSPFEVRRSLRHPGTLDVRNLDAVAAMVVGEHDFRAFTPTTTQHRHFTRVVEQARWHSRGDVLEFEITADSFLRHMVRTLVGSMLELDPDDFAGLLAGARRSDAGRTAPPWGLYLVAVGYD
jgi:tRNA pseudouridine38-40 synthase